MKEKLASLWTNLEEYLCCVFLAGIITLLMAQVLYRYIGGRSLAWSEEVCRFLFLYLVYFAASLATAKNLHIRVTAQLKLLPRFLQIGLLALNDLLWLAFCTIVIWVGTEFLISMHTRPMISGALMLDMRWVYLAIPLAFTLQSVRIIERWVRVARGRETIAVPGEEVF